MDAIYDPYVSDFLASGGTPNSLPDTTGGSNLADSSGGSSGYLSGLGDLFNGIGKAVATDIAAANPTPTFSLFPRVTSTGVNTSVSSGSLFSNPIVLLILAVVAVLFFRKRG